MSTTASSTLYAPGARAASGVWLHWFAIVVAGCTFCLLLAGSMVTTTGSGLSVPDWPTTYGENMFTFPPSKWVGGIWYEHVHRLIGSAVGFLTIVLCAWLWFSRSSRRVKWVGTMALVTVCVQGLLGGLTVWYMLPTWISVAHAGLAEIFFCITVCLAVVTAPRWRGNRAPSAREVAQAPDESGFHSACGSLSASAGRSLKKVCMLALVCVYVQILLGAVMRHTQSGQAILDFPLSYGALLPPMSTAALESINLDRVWEQDLEAVTLGQMWIHFAHRAGAVVVAIAVVLLVRHVLAVLGRRRDFVILAMGLAGLLILQVTLGAVTIWTRSELLITTAHVGGGALMLATCVVLLLRVYSGSFEGGEGAGVVESGIASTIDARSSTPRKSC
ncbi:MAG: COX15/CtaA family protein [Planctomycetes bacterium]|nr:COX15/CtaA family protein [Planctomycetota bacterium]